MKHIAALLPALLLSGCVSVPAVPVPEFSGLADNTCLPEAIVVAASFGKQGITAHIVIIRTPSFSHAVVAFLYPAEMPSLWVWDADNRSVQIEADFNSPTSIAIAWFRQTLRDETVISAEFM